MSRRNGIRTLDGYVQECEFARRFSLSICDRATRLAEQFNETLAALIHQSRLLGQQVRLAPRQPDEWPKFVSAYRVADVMLGDIEAYRKDLGDATQQAENVLNEIRKGCANAITTIDELYVAETDNRAQLSSRKDSHTLLSIDTSSMINAL